MNALRRVASFFDPNTQERDALERAYHNLILAFYRQPLPTDNTGVGSAYSMDGVSILFEPNQFGTWPSRPTTLGIQPDGVMYREPPQAEDAISHPLSVKLQSLIDAWNKLDERGKRMSANAIVAQRQSLVRAVQRIDRERQERIDRQVANSTLGMRAPPPSFQTTVDARRQDYASSRIRPGDLTGGRSKKRRTKRRPKRKRRKSKRRRTRSRK